LVKHRGNFTFNNGKWIGLAQYLAQWRELVLAALNISVSLREILLVKYSKRKTGNIKMDNIKKSVVRLGDGWNCLRIIYAGELSN
jgi:hypothetical protein